MTKKYTAWLVEVTQYIRKFFLIFFKNWAILFLYIYIYIFLLLYYIYFLRFFYFRCKCVSHLGFCLICLTIIEKLLLHMYQYFITYICTLCEKKIFFWKKRKKIACSYNIEFIFSGVIYHHSLFYSRVFYLYIS